MFITTYCTSCSGKIAPSAAFCVHCGATNPHAGRGVLEILLLAVLLVVWGCASVSEWFSRLSSTTTSTIKRSVDKPAQSMESSTEAAGTDGTDSDWESSEFDENKSAIQQLPETIETSDQSPLANGELRPKLAPVDAQEAAAENAGDSKLPVTSETPSPQIRSTVPTSSLGTTQQFGDARWGFTFEVPVGLFVQQHSPDSDGTTMILVSAQNDEDVLLTASRTQSSAATAKELMHEMIRANPSWKYSHKKARGDSATLSGSNGDKIFYRRSVLRDGQSIGFCIEYPRSLKTKYNDAVEMLVSTFTTP